MKDVKKQCFTGKRKSSYFETSEKQVQKIQRFDQQGLSKNIINEHNMWHTLRKISNLTIQQMDQNSRTSKFDDVKDQDLHPVINENNVKYLVKSIHAWRWKKGHTTVWKNYLQ